MININMRCIEISNIDDINSSEYLININMRCIEIFHALMSNLGDIRLTLT